MSIAALITEGIGPGGSVTYILTGGLDLGESPTPPPTTTWTPVTPVTTVWTPATD